MGTILIVMLILGYSIYAIRSIIQRKKSGGCCGSCCHCEQIVSCKHETENE